MHYFPDGQELTADPVASVEQPGLLTQDVDLETLVPLVDRSTMHSPNPEECPLDDEILVMLGASPPKSKKLGINIQKDLALRWDHLVTSGLTKECRKDLIEKHLVPGNCEKLTAPLLNPEIKAALSETMIGKDKGTELKQNQIASAISCIGEALTGMFKSEHKDALIIKSLLDGAQLLCDFQYCESMKRRSLICASIKKDIKGQLYETKIDSHLFGEKLPETLKAAKAINKSGAELKFKTTAARRPLNQKPQLATSRQPVKRRQEPAYTQIPTAFQPPVPPQRRQYPMPAPLPQLPPPPPPPAPSQPLPPRPQQRSKPRPYQRR